MMMLVMVGGDDDDEGYKGSRIWGLYYRVKLRKTTSLLLLIWRRVTKYNYTKRVNTKTSFRLDFISYLGLVTTLQ